MSSKVQDWFREHAGRFSGQLLFDEPLSRHTYYRIGGPATVVAIPKEKADVEWLIEGIRATGTRFFILGQGSNVLASDDGFEGVVIKAGRLNLEIELIPGVEPPRVRTGGSVAISTLLRRAAQEGWAGLEFLTGIPGSVGGVVSMNAGTHLGETQGHLRKVEAYSILAPVGESEINSVYQETDLRFQYRKNLFLPQGSLVWSAEWEIRMDDPARVKEAIDQTLARRKATQPIDYPSCGSVFKNPEEGGMSAWQVIDRLGLRGYRKGDAQFAMKHSNFIINLGEAKASDVRTLIDLAKAKAKRELTIILEEEVIYLGP